METVRFDLTFDSTTNTGVYPTVEIKLNDSVLCPTQTISKTETVSFDADLSDGQSYSLVIVRGNHMGRGEQMLSIKKVEADGINLNKLFDEVYCFPEYPKQWLEQQIKAGHSWPEKQKGWRDLGFNGKWVIDFDTPFYTWLLKNT